MTITLAVLLGFALDWLLGDPKKLPHPVCAVGKLISGTEKVLRRIFPATPASWLSGHHENVPALRLSCRHVQETHLNSRTGKFPRCRVLPDGRIPSIP